MFFFFIFDSVCVCLCRLTRTIYKLPSINIDCYFTFLISRLCTSALPVRVKSICYFGYNSQWSRNVNVFTVDWTHTNFCCHILKRSCIRHTGVHERIVSFIRQLPFAARSDQNSLSTYKFSDVICWFEWTRYLLSEAFVAMRPTSWFFLGCNAAWPCRS